ncbi:hypothetical protein [Aquimarina sp. AD1]|uniref:hypothetical protein n=1 Tax=Aquimarina sp. (strain AD1) TaxID=1714848 RepID=UPI001F07607B|nr:hypothetical protein [Aquimarina sp. AD1]
MTVPDDTIYNTDGTLTGNRVMTMGNFNLQFDSDLDNRNTLTLRRTNNARELGISFRNSGNAYAAAIGFGTTANGNNNGLNFYAGGNQGDPADIQETLSLRNNNQIRFSRYGTIDTYQFDNTPTRFLGIEADGDVVTVDPASIGSDDQTASEVDSDTPVDVDGDGNTEATVEDVIQDIAPITSKAARIFYPPSIAIDASTISANTAAPGDESVDLYQQYIDQFTLANAATSQSSAGAPGAIPTYAANELYYYVTYFDPTVFANVAIDANGVMTYDIIGTPADYNTLINVVFVVR